MEKLVYTLLKELGEDPDRDGLARTPYRVAKSLKLLTSGYSQEPEDVLGGAFFEEESDEMILVKNIEVYSLCEHHLLPFYGKCHIAYIPKGKIVGLSKLARLADLYSRRLQVQERLTHQIANTVEKYLEPEGVGVIIEARHLCMMMRGVEKQNSIAVTSAMLGSFRREAETRMEFMNLVRQ